MPKPSALVVNALVLLFASAALAQLPNAGNTTATPASGDQHSLVETVNPANGAASVRISVRMPEGRQFTLPFSFAYDSNGAFYIGSPPFGGGPTYRTILSTIGSIGGWSYSYPVMGMNGGMWTIPNNLDGYYKCYGSTNYVFQDVNGNRHNLGLSVSANLASPDGENCNEGLTGDGEFTTGGEGPILATTSIPPISDGTFPGVAVWDGDGTSYNLPGGHPGSQGLTTLATNATDRNGNSVTITNNSGAVTYTDTIGRSVLSVSGMGGSPDTITVGGLASPYHIYWTPASASFPDNMLNLSTNPIFQPCPTNLAGTSTVVSSIVLPNNQTFAFTYDSTYGMLSQITYPSGGYVRYVWNLNPQAEAGVWYYTSTDGLSYAWACRYDFPAITDRYVSYDGNPSHEVLHQHFAYNTTWPDNTSVTWTTKTTTVTTYDLLRGTNFTTAYTYSPLATDYVPNCVSCNDSHQMPIEQTIQYKDIGGAPLRTVTKAWKNIRLLQSEQTTLDNSQSSLTVYCYDANEQVTERDEYGFGTSAPSPAPCASVPNGTQSGPLLRKTATSYAAFTAHIVDRPATVTTYDGSSSRVAETDSFYDQTGSANRGNLTTQAKQCFILPGGQACPQGNSTTTFTYDGNGQLLTMVDPNGNASGGTPAQHTTTYSYADSYSSCGGSAPPTIPSDAYLTQVTFPPTLGVNHIVNYCYDYSKGLLLSSTDENTRTTTYTYSDALDRLRQAAYPDTGQTSYWYNDSPPAPSVTQASLITSTLSLSTTSVMNGFGDLTQTQLTTDPEGADYTDTTYDGSGRVWTRSNPHRSAASPTDGTTTYVYDALGRTKSVSEPDGSAATTSYAGNCTTVTDETLKTRTSCVDGLGRLTGVWEDPGTKNYETDYQYDGLGNLTRVDQKGGDSNSADWRTRLFTYDSFSRLLSATNPESGTISYSYDANGNVTSKISPKQNQTNPNTKVTLSYCYDARNRLTSMAYTTQSCPQSSPATTYTYDQGTNGTGRRTSMTDSGGSSSWTYEVMGRVASETRVTSNVTKTTSYLYNLDGSVKSITYPSTRTVNYTYSGAARALTAVDPNGPINYVTSAMYAPPGELATSTNGLVQGGFTGITTASIYNSRLQPVLLSAASPTASVLSLCYDFHLKIGINQPPCSFSAGAGDNGNVFEIVNNHDTNRTQNFSYDNLNRIQQAWTSGPTWGETFGPQTAPGGTPSTSGIDAWGNLWQRSPVTGKTYSEPLSATALSNNQLVGFGYDAAGNMTSNGSSTYQYNAENQLTKFITTTTDIYVYDGDGRRVKKNVGAVTLYWYDTSGDVLDETSYTGALAAEYVYFNGKRVARRDASNNSVHYYFSDHLGSASVVTDAVGTMSACPLANSPMNYTTIPTGEEESDFYPYGGEMKLCDRVSQNYKFTGKERDTESGLDEFGARYYASSLGRFMIPDWAEKPTDVPYAEFGDPQSLNLYGYVRNNPLSKADPDGHDPIAIALQLSGPLLECPVCEGILWGGAVMIEGYIAYKVYKSNQASSAAPDTAVSNQVLLSQHGKGHKRETAFENMSDAQVSAIAHNPNDPNRQKAKREEKARKQRASRQSREQKKPPKPEPPKPEPPKPEPPKPEPPKPEPPKQAPPKQAPPQPEPQKLEGGA